MGEFDDFTGFECTLDMDLYTISDILFILENQTAESQCECVVFFDHLERFPRASFAGVCLYMISTCFKIGLDKKYLFRKKFSADSDHRVVKINPILENRTAGSQCESVIFFDHLGTFPRAFFAGA